MKEIKIYNSVDFYEERIAEEKENIEKYKQEIDYFKKKIEEEKQKQKQHTPTSNQKKAISILKEVFEDMCSKNDDELYSFFYTKSESFRQLVKEYEQNKS